MNQTRIALPVYSALLLSALVPLCASAAPGSVRDLRNVITRIEASEHGSEVVLRIHGSEAPSFTQYRLDAPSRVVLDLGDAVLAGPASEIPVNLEALSMVRTLMYEANGLSFARIVLETGEERATRVSVEGSTLVVRLGAGEDGRSLARRHTATAGGASNAVDAAKRAAAAESELSQARAKVVALEAAADKWRTKAESSNQRLDRALSEAHQAAAKTRDEAAAFEAANQELARRRSDLLVAQQALATSRGEAERSRVAQASAESALQAEREQREQAVREVKHQVQRAQLAQLALGSSAHERDVAKARAEAAARRLSEAEHALGQAKQEVGTLQSQLAQIRAAAKRQGVQQAQARAESEALAREESAARRALEEQLEQLRKRGALAHDGDRNGTVSPGRRYAYAQYEGGEAGGAGPGRESGGVQVDNRPKVMSRVGFQQRPDVSRVYVRTNAPARYSVSEQGKEIWLEIENTRAASMNDLNHLDTRFFDTAVANVDPEEIEGAGTHIRVRIQMKSNVPYEVTRSGNEIRIDFRRPGQ